MLLRLVIPFSFEDSIMNDVFYSNKNPLEISNQVIVQSMEGTRENTINSSILPKVQENIARGVYNDDVDHSRYFRDILNQYVLYIWLFGVIIAFTVNLVGYIRFLQYLKQGYKPATDEENRILATLLNGRKYVRLVRNRFVTTPMLIGILRPYIIIPDGYFNEKQLKNILLHEISHLRRFDIGVKWLTMIATSIHWFNPLMYFIKKEINHACELACDEAVIKNLSPAEKQAYGDTLISVIAEHKYSASVLQATMCEEKKSLKERLVAIMNHNKKSRLIIIFSGILLGVIILGALYLGAGIGSGKDTPPNIYISAEGEKTKVALMGSYSWENGGEHIQSDSDHPINFEYKLDNAVSVAGKEQLIISTQKLKRDKQYDFTIEDMAVYKDNQLIEFKKLEPSFMNGDLYIQAPPDAGEYIYTLRLNFKNKGTVSYGFIVRVDMLTYNLAEISKYKTPYVGDNSKVSAIVSHLPVPERYFKQQYISMETSEKPYSLTVYYEAATGAEYEGEWPIVAPYSVIEINSRANALVIFCMIDNLEEVTFAFRDSQSDGKLDESQYNTTFTFPRASFEEEYGDLSVLGGKLELLQDVLTEKTPVKEFQTDGQFSQEVIDLVENNLKIIMSSPKESSNPRDYIKAHQNEYEDIIKYGNEEVLEYMLSQFKEDNVEGLRGQLVMRLCKELLGQRNNITDESLSPMEWFAQLNVRQEIILSDFSYDGTDLIEKLVYETEIEKNKTSREGFTIVAPHIFGSYEEANKLKVFVTTFSSHYRLYDKVLSEEGGSIVPVAITYVKNTDGSYSLEEYQQAMDGSYFGSSIKEFCTMPVSGKNIKGLADKILDHYGDYEDIIKLERENLIKHLKANNQYEVSLYQKHYKKPVELIPLT